MIYEQNDLLRLFKDNHFTAIAHQCNLTTENVAGIAKVIFKEFPKAFRKDYLHKLEYFGSYSLCGTEYGDIVNLYAQYYPGSPTFKFIDKSLVRDDFTTRLRALRFALANYKASCSVNEKIVLGIPLLASGLASDQSKKILGMSDLEYFQMYIEPTVNSVVSDNFIVKVIYL